MNTKRLTIGLLIDWIENPYHCTLLSGINASAKERDCNILVYVGGTPHSGFSPEIRRTIIYEFVHKKNVDGLIIATGSIGRCSTSEQLETFCKKYLPLPIVTIAQKVADFPVIRIDNKNGIKDLIYHLIDHHHLKNFAYVSGPKTNQDAIERFGAFSDTLKEKNIPLRQEAVVEGSFVIESGIRAVRILLNERKITPDVIIAANDDMAVGVIRELQNQGIRVPEDIAVVGFDNQEIYQYLNPPLTTIQQPIYSLGKNSVEILIQNIKGNSITKHLALPTKMVIRNSCGCSAESFQFKEYNTPDTQNRKSAAADNTPHTQNRKSAAADNTPYTQNRKSAAADNTPYTQNRKSAAADNTPETQTGTYNKAKISDTLYEKIKTILLKTDCRETESITPAYITSLVDKFFDSIENIDIPAFPEEMKNLIQKLIISETEETLLQNIITICKETFIPSMNTERLRDRGCQLFDYLRCYISKLKEEEHGTYNVMATKEILTFRTHIESLMEKPEIDHFLNDLESIFKDIQIRSFYISKYRDLDMSNPSKATLDFFFAYKDGMRIDLNGKEITCPAVEILPDPFVPKDRRFLLIIEPLFTGLKQVGCAFMELPVHKEIISNMMLRTLLYNMLKNTLFIQKLQDQSERLQKKTEELTISNDMLQKSLLEREKNEEEVRKLNEELEERVKQRTSELNLANNNLTVTLDSLKQMQNELVESEKMAALGNLVAGIAHEINTPIGIGVTAASHLEKETKKIFTNFVEQNITKSDLNTYIETAQEASSMILSNLKRAYELIRSFKDIAVDQSHEEVREFNIKSYIQDILLSLRPRLKKVNHLIHIDCPEDLTISSFPGAFSQIITNLLINTLTHGYDEHDRGTIIITIRKNDSTLSLIYRDEGNGIEKKHLSRIFDPFFTTNRKNGGTGLGLHLVYNIIRQRLGGTITCKSEKGKGVCFSITIPLHKNTITKGDIQS
ncbi:MAG: substrate-binding domain-containing protein [Spirochaetales bacterium]|nr:substrate-binding domain-containing protein [Spirochaetales bacterium]